MISSGTHPHEYRPDIDGLRAVAVLAVIGYHAFPRVVVGGFVGVDVFFVISGYLISGILFRHSARGRVDLADFYVRRIRRIFPALIVVLPAVGVLGWMTLTNEDFRELERHIAGGAFFVSNFVLWADAGYFDAPARFKPLLHLWSLGIEEQFYLLWPPVVYLCARRGWNAGRVAAAIVVASFALCVRLAPSNPEAGFYLPATRMWELLLGGLLALSESAPLTRRPAPTDTSPTGGGGTRANLTSLAGLGLIVAATLVLTRATPYPGWRAALPVAGTLLVIHAGANAWINRVALGSPPAVYIGLISYPLYLWHWPLLSFLHITEGGAPATALKVWAIAVSFVLAAITYHAVERPIRSRVSRATPRRVAVIASALMAAGAVALVAKSQNLFTSRSPRLYGGIYSRIASPRHNAACESRFPSGGEYCQTYDSAAPVTTALVGDSHAEHFLLGVGAHLARRGENVVNLGQSGCAPLLDLERYYNEGNDTCRPVVNSVIRYVAGNPSLRRVLLSFKGSVAVTGEGWDVDRVIFILKGTQLSNAESVRQALENTVRLLVSQQKEVWLLLQVPELEFDLPQCFSRPFSIGGRIRTPCAVPKSAALERQKLYRDIVFDVQRRVPELKVFDPLPFLCDDQWCHAVVGHELLYADENHLSREGSIFFADAFPF